MFSKSLFYIFVKATSDFLLLFLFPQTMFCVCECRRQMLRSMTAGQPFPGTSFSPQLPAKGPHRTGPMATP